MNQIKAIFSVLLLITMIGSVRGQEVPESPTDISPLLIGEQIPDRVLKTTNGEDVSLQEIFSDKPTVLIFYRGGWCPFCNMHLAELQSIENDILELGYQIVAISPDSPEKLNTSVQKNDLNYKLLSDGDMETTKAFGIAYKAPERNTKRLSEYSGGKNPGLLPVPSVFVISTEGTILFEYINPNYRTRISGGLLKAVLEEVDK